MQQPAALLLVCLLAAPVTAGERHTAGPAAAGAPRRAPFLWRVERDGRTSHLFGTVHVGLDLDAALAEAGRAALDDARRVFVELDLTSPAVIVDLLRTASARSELPPGQSLRKLLAPAAWDRLTALYRGRLPPAALDRMQPWFATLSSLPLVVPARAVDTVRSPRLSGPPLDAAIAARARERGIRVMPLETPLQQIQALIGMGRGEGAVMLEELYGERGLVALLRGRGHRVERVR